MRLNKYILPPTITTESKVFLVEVALLSRNIFFEAYVGDDNKIWHGYNLIVLHTPDVKQKLECVDLRGFFQQANIGRCEFTNL